MCSLLLLILLTSSPWAVKLARMQIWMGNSRGISGRNVGGIPGEFVKGNVWEKWLDPCAGLPVSTCCSYDLCHPG